ncbi:NAD(+) diphosphatase [Isoalcanivorax beigongshangi]|uniref:NAD-capped RNA hydrolase NudC n=1 Tax=Isoalcanivorax beigongshangi TaxID=3238810 RepID=A0ABV4AGT5_9GAMM
MFDDLELIPRPLDPNGRRLWFLFHHTSLWVSEDPDLPLLPEVDSAAALGLADRQEHYLGRLRGLECYAMAMASADEKVPGFYPEELRRLIGAMDEPTFTMAARASQVLTWHRDHQFCARCGQRTAHHPHDRAMSCEQCGLTQYPRISPCIITLVTRGDEVLLARNQRFPARFFSCLAGFIEAGESAEQAVHREVHEEVALRLGELEYYGSQSWPFPHSLMLGFFAEYHSGDIQVDGEEIAEAYWWHMDELPTIPPPGSIARGLIETWLQRRRALRGDGGSADG